MLTDDPPVPKTLESSASGAAHARTSIIDTSFLPVGDEFHLDFIQLRATWKCVKELSLLKTNDGETSSRAASTAIIKTPAQISMSRQKGAHLFIKREWGMHKKIVYDEAVHAAVIQ